jgi:hypothetical protein
MTAAELLLEDFNIEISNTRRTLERLPNGKADWRMSSGRPSKQRRP